MTREESTAVATEVPGTRQYHRILVPLDGSTFAEAALRPAAELATKCGGAVRLVSVLSDKPHQGQMVSLNLAPLPPEGIGRVEPRVQQLEQRLSDAADRIRERWDCDVSVDVITDAPTSETLLRLAEEWDADLIVAATHSKGLIARGLLGSTSADLSREASCPVLLVPSEDAEPDLDETPLQDGARRIAVALDNDAELGDPVLTHAESMARLWDASLVLIHAVPILPAPSVQPGAALPTAVGPGLAMDKEAVEKAESRIDDIVSALADKGVETRAEVLQGPRAADTVLQLAESVEADLLVVGRHDRSVWERLWKGSESDRLVRTIRSTGLLVTPLGSA